MVGDTATLILRKKTGDIYNKLEHKIAIRSKNNNFYISHKNVDVSVMYLPWPDSAYKPPRIPDYLLADDRIIKKNNITSGFEVRCLGYPLGLEANNAGFPILRSGNIASFPLYPSKIYPTFFVDIKIFEGNSGGPVYYSRGEFKNILTYGNGGFKNIHYILGIVSKEKIAKEKKSFIYGEETKVTQMSIAVIVNASYIKELIMILKQAEK